VLVIVAPGQGAQSPGFLAPWLEDATFASRFEWLSTVADLDLAHYGTDADAETIRDTKIAQPLLVATGLIAALELFPHPADAFSHIGAVAGHSVGEIAAAAGARVITAEQAMVLVRERGNAMAEASAAAATGMTAVLGGDRDEVLAALEAHGLTAANENGRAADQGAPGAAERRGCLPHRPHGAGCRPDGHPGPLGVHARPSHAGDLQP
jgi:[acyl-carrier-protein] S-malonyltransferase